MTLLIQITQIFGSLLILIAFALLQMKTITISSRSYLLLNVVGSVLLAVTALIEQQWGFLFLEAIWAIVSLIALVRRG